MQYVEKYISFSITWLKKSGYLKSNCDFYNVLSTWVRNGEVESSIRFDIVNINSQLKQLTFKYSVNERPVNYKVNIEAFPSNLGIGYRWYFICPITGKRCMNLVKPSFSDYFYHRTAFGLLYKQQFYNKNEMDSLFLTLYKLDKRDILIEELNRKYKKNHYRGKPTPLVKKIQSLEYKIHKNYGYLF